MRRAPRKEIDPTPRMPRGTTEFEERWIATDFTNVFKRISDAYWGSVRSPVEYAYRAGFIAGKSRRELEVKGSPKLPTFIKIL